MDIDFIALQECAQNKSSAIKEGIVRVDNMALIISDRLRQKYNANYNYVWNWSHYGWTVWEEGLAILSKYPLLASEDRYISSVTDDAYVLERLGRKVKILKGTPRNIKVTTREDLKIAEVLI